MTETCDHSVGYLTRHFSPDEGPRSNYDLAMEFADDDTLAVFVAHHEMTKDIRNLLSSLATGLTARIELLNKGEF